MRKLTHSEILQERLNPEQALNIERSPISILLYNVRSLYNVGSVFRTADAALAQELILCGFTPHPPRKEIEKTALGAVDSVPWNYFKKTEDAVSYLKSKKIKLIALELTEKKRKYDSLEISDFPMCLLVGNELSGLDNSILELCDDAIEIPMLGTKHSLNVSVVTGIALFEALRIWKLNN